MWELDCEESWAPKNWCFLSVVWEKTLESFLGCKEIQPFHSKGDQSWVFIGKWKWKWSRSVMSDSLWPHTRQPTRLLCPWDSPGKNTGVGCHFLLQCMKVKRESQVAQLCPTLSDPMDCSLPGSSVHGIFKARVLELGAIAYSLDYSMGLDCCP